MFALLALLAITLAPVVHAATATIFPNGFGPGNSLHGEIIGTGSVGTTYVLSGETSGVPFTGTRFPASTMTLAEDASRVAETFAIPAQSLEGAIGCVVSGGSAICENIVGGATATTTLLETVPFSPFAVPVSSGGAAASASSRTGSGVSTHSSAPSGSSTLSASASSVASRTTIAPSSAATPGSTQSTSEASRVPVAALALLLPLVGAFWVLV